MFKVDWTGTYPCLCCGEWIIFKNNINVSNFIPEDKKTIPMGTKSTYSKWHFEDWVEVFEDYEDGLECDEWIEENNDWISKFCDNQDEKSQLFLAIQAQDWRYGSCGGCI